MSTTVASVATSRPRSASAPPAFAPFRPVLRFPRLPVAPTPVSVASPGLISLAAARLAARRAAAIAAADAAQRACLRAVVPAPAPAMNDVDGDWTFNHIMFGED